MTRLPITVMVSGEGTNLQALIDAVSRGELNADVRCVLSSSPSAPAIGRAQRAGIPVSVLANNVAEHLLAELQKTGAALICLAGYMKVLPAEVVDSYPNKIMNIHPALLPKFQGLNAIERALKSGEGITGVTVHFVDRGVDTGPIILQEEVPILSGDTLGSLTQRIHEVEHRLYPHAIQLYADGKIKVDGRKVLISK